MNLYKNNKRIHSEKSLSRGSSARKQDTMTKLTIGSDTDLNICKVSNKDLDSQIASDKDILVDLENKPENSIDLEIAESTFTNNSGALTQKHNINESQLSIGSDTELDIIKASRQVSEKSKIISDKDIGDLDDKPQHSLKGAKSDSNLTGNSGAVTEEIKKSARNSQVSLRNSEKDFTQKTGSKQSIFSGGMTNNILANLSEMCNGLQDSEKSLSHVPSDKNSKPHSHASLGKNTEVNSAKASREDLDKSKEASDREMTIEIEKKDGITQSIGISESVFTINSNVHSEKDAIKNSLKNSQTSIKHSQDRLTNKSDSKQSITSGKVTNNNLSEKCNDLQDSEKSLSQIPSAKNSKPHSQASLGKNTEVNSAKASREDLDKSKEASDREMTIEIENKDGITQSIGISESVFTINSNVHSEKDAFKNSMKNSQTSIKHSQDKLTNKSGSKQSITSGKVTNNNLSENKDGITQSVGITESVFTINSNVHSEKDAFKNSMKNSQTSIKHSQDRLTNKSGSKQSITSGKVTNNNLSEKCNDLQDSEKSLSQIPSAKNSKPHSQASLGKNTEVNSAKASREDLDKS